jgi:hypothetical protein
MFLNVQMKGRNQPRVSVFSGNRIVRLNGSPLMTHDGAIVSQRGSHLQVKTASDEYSLPLDRLANVGLVSVSSEKDRVSVIDGPDGPLAIARQIVERYAHNSAMMIHRLRVAKLTPLYPIAMATARFNNAN